MLTTFYLQPVSLPIPYVGCSPGSLPSTVTVPQEHFCPTPRWDPEDHIAYTSSVFLLMSPTQIT